MKRLFWNRHTKLIAKHAVGWMSILFGVICGFIPVLQGWFFILLGIYLLADEIPFFARIKARIERRFPKTANYAHRESVRIRERFHKKK